MMNINRQIPSPWGDDLDSGAPPRQRVVTLAKPGWDSEPVANLSREAVADISRYLRQLLADVFTLYIKTKNFHWHIGGPHFRDYRLLLGDQSEEIVKMADTIAERARKIGGASLRSIGDISRHQRLSDNDREFVEPFDMLAELRADNRELTRTLRSAHEFCNQQHDFATAGLLQTYIDQAERRVWFLSEVACFS